jgi:hypothetical protein
MILDANGQYEVRGPAARMPAFFWGADGTSMDHRWELQGVAADGSVWAAIQLIADGDNVRVAAMRNIKLSEDGRRLSFDILYDSGNRVHVELVRGEGRLPR